MRTIILFASLAICVTANYANYKVYKVETTSADDVNTMFQLQDKPGIDFWSRFGPASKSATIMVAPEFQKEFHHRLNQTGTVYEEIIKNVESMVQAERMENLLESRTTNRLQRYNTYNTIVGYLDQLAVDYPSIVRVASSGKSFEKRDIKYISISTGGTEKPTIFIDAGIHAREWIAPAVVMNFISFLVEDKANRHMIEKVNWIILPVVNPDGYEYTHTQNRLWRKTRSMGKECYGVDANRNFDFHWKENGASEFECSNTYAGPKASSEPETQALKRLIQKHAKNIKLYLTFHSYGNYLLYPWGFTSTLPENANELDSLARKVAESIKRVAGTEYTVGSSTNVLYPAAGGSDDWVKGVAGVDLVYTIELPGGGPHGFDPATSAIRGITAETWEGMKVFYKHIFNMHAF